MERKQYSIEEVENCRTNAGLTKKQFAEFIKLSYNSLCAFYMGKKESQSKTDGVDSSQML